MTDDEIMKVPAGSALRAEKVRYVEYIETTLACSKPECPLAERNLIK